jgi:AcrR family transcriptional regulator
MLDSKKPAKRCTPEACNLQPRSVATRKKLLASARTIFARDGFEQARLEEIAATAGKTRGALYDHFQDKEDIFCAIYEENITRDLAHLVPRLLDLSTVDQRIDALAEYLGELSRDRERILLSLEFKLYAIRHPQKRRRLADLHSLMCIRTCIPELSVLIPQLSRDTPEAQLLQTLAVGGTLDGLALSHLFDPDTFDHTQVVRYLRLFLRETLLNQELR